jgi:hypothetical protein
MTDDRTRRRMDMFRDGFNQAMREKGDPRTLDEVCPGWDKVPMYLTPETHDVITELLRDTTDESPAAVLQRAVMVYRSIVRHVRGGGRVVFEGDGPARTLKVRVKT